MPANPEKPTCISIIICDDIYRDEDTKKLVIIGTFNRIVAPTVPCKHPRLVVLFTITNAKGNYDVSLSIEHERTGHQVIEMCGPFRADDPLTIHDVNVTLQNLDFPEAGKYWVTLKADGEIIQQRPFLVETRGEPKERQ